jgi:hypothetical protein
MTRLLLITGAQKSASTSVADWLTASPQAVLLAPRVRQLGTECLALEGRSHRLSTARVQRRARAATSSGLVPVMKRPEILHSPALRARAADAFPDALAIAILRKPVSRSVSAWWHYRYHGLIRPDLTLRDCVAAYLRHGNHVPAGQVVGFSLYAESARGLRREFKAPEVVFNEDVVRSPKVAFAHVLEQVGLCDATADTLPVLNTRADVAQKAPTVPPRLANAVSYRWDKELDVPARRFPGWLATAATQRLLLGLGRSLASGKDFELDVGDEDLAAVFEATVRDLDALEEELGQEVPAGWRRLESDRAATQLERE